MLSLPSWPSYSSPRRAPAAAPLLSAGLELLRAAAQHPRVGPLRFEEQPQPGPEVLRPPAEPAVPAQRPLAGQWPELREAPSDLRRRTRPAPLPFESAAPRFSTERQNTTTAPASIGVDQFT